MTNRPPDDDPMTDTNPGSPGSHRHELSDVASGNGHDDTVNDARVTNASEKDRARGLALLAKQLMADHERVYHAGDTCQTERIDFVAFMAHRLGVRDRASVIRLIEYISAYEQHHADHHP